MRGERRNWALGRARWQGLIFLFFVFSVLGGTVFEFGDVFCFTDFLSGFLFRVRGVALVRYSSF